MNQLAPWQLEVFKSVLALLLLGATWGVGNRIIVFWDGRKKRQELDIAAAERFQQLYGELKEVARIWRSAKKPRGDSPRPPDTLQWDLLARVTAAEARYETLVIKLATERELSPEQTMALGLFRQAVQQARNAIRQGKLVPASGFGAEYLAFNDLAAEVACLLGSNARYVNVGTEVGRRNLEAIAKVGSGQWHKRVASYAKADLPGVRADESAGVGMPDKPTAMRSPAT